MKRLTNLYKKTNIQIKLTMLPESALYDSKKNRILYISKNGLYAVTNP